MTSIIRKLFIAILMVSALQNISLGAKIYVSTKGSDRAGNGRKENPYATLYKALDVASKSAGASEVILEEGVYFMPEEGISLKNYPNKNSPLTIRGLGDVTLHGGVRISAEELEEVKSPDLLRRLPDKRGGVLYALDLKKFGVSKVGNLRPYGFGSGDAPAQTEAFFSAMPLTLAKYPNGNKKIPLGKILEDGFNKNNPSSWDNSKEKIGGVFAYTDERHERWVNAKDLWLSGIFHYGWAYNTVKVKKIDTEVKSVILDPQLPWGLQKKHKKLVVNAYQAINLFEELDVVGEYYIDREKLYFYVVLDKKPSAEEYFDFSLLREAFFELSDTENFTVKNVKFTAACDLAIKGLRCDKFVVDNCEFFNLGTSAVNVSSADVEKHSPERLASINNEFKNCKVHDTGSGGVSFSGGDEAKLLPSRNVISNSEFWNNARLHKSYSAHVTINGVGGMLSHCYFHDQSHMSVGYSGSEHVFEYNYFERCCRNFDDMGIIYTGRLPYNRGNIIRYNFFAETVASHRSSMICGVYIDDGSGGTLIEKNIFCRVGTPGRYGGFSAVYFHGGKDNIVKENVFIDCDVSASQVQWSDDKWESYWLQYPTSLRFVDSELYIKKYPEMKDIMSPSLKRMNSMFGCKLFRTQPPLRGKWDLQLPMSEMKPDVPCGKIDYWNLDLVNKYFGKDPLVRNILDKKPGILK